MISDELRPLMRSGKTKIASLVVLITNISILVVIAACDMQLMPLITQTPSITLSAYRPSPSPTITEISTLSAIELENLFGNSSCSWPCWQGITPGITTIPEALQLLHLSPLILEDSIQVKGPMTGFGWLDWQWKMSEQQPINPGKLRWKDGIVSNIGLGTNQTTSLGEIINRFGPPEKISVMDCTEIVEGLQWWCASLFYATNGFEINVEWERIASEVYITPEDPTNFVSLFTPSTIEEWYLSLGLNPQNLELQDWKGYGNLLELYVP